MGGAAIRKTPEKLSRAGGWADVFRGLLGDSPARWVPAGRNPGLEALVLRRLKKAYRGERVRMNPAVPAPVPPTGASGTSAQRN